MARQGFHNEDEDMNLIFSHARKLPKCPVNFNTDGVIIVGGIQQNAQIREQGKKLIIIQSGVIKPKEYEIEAIYAETKESSYLYLVFDFKIRRVLYFDGIICFCKIY